MMELHPFKNMFHQLWKAGDTAHLNLDTHTGQAWIGLRTPLEYSDQPDHYPPQTPTHRHYTPQSPSNCSPSYYRRQECRKAAKVADTTINNTKDTPAAEADCVTPTEKVENPHHAPESEKNQRHPFH